MKRRNKELKKRNVNVHFQNEFRTSKLCCKCQTELVSVRHKCDASDYKKMDAEDERKTGSHQKQQDAVHQPVQKLGDKQLHAFLGRSFATKGPGFQ